MKQTKLLLKGFWAIAAVLFSGHVHAQTSPAKPATDQGVKTMRIYGRIYDESQRFALPGVSVLGSSSGIGTMTDSAGNYSIRLPKEDSIVFSYVGRGTTKIPVAWIPDDGPMNLSLNVNVDSLPTVLVRPKDYVTDSVQNRKDYQKVFDYNSSYLSNMKMSQRGAGLGIGLNLDMMFNGKKNRQMEALQARLEQEEQDRYIDHKFNRALVKRLTGLQPPALDTFMRQYRPTKEFIQSCETDYEYYHYIQEWGKLFGDWWKDSHPDADVKKDTSARKKRSLPFIAVKK